MIGKATTNVGGHKTPGYATAEGTFKYSQRKAGQINPDAFGKTHSGLTLSKLGLGSYIGDTSSEHDRLMFEAVLSCVHSGGVNVLDTAINYRSMKSEKAFGAAIKQLLSEGYSREEFFVSTKGGYLSDDADRPDFSQNQLNKLLSQRKISPEDLVDDCHCMHPAFIEEMINTSLDNLQLETIDLYYLHNPAESQLSVIGEAAFLQKTAKAFEMLEMKRKEGKIRSYGIATWGCFRAPPTDQGNHLSLEKVVQIAKQVGGNDHGFRYIQLPINGLMMEAAEKENTQARIRQSMCPC